LEVALTERVWKLPWRPSIFSKLLAIMLGMIAVLLVTVTAFFMLVVFPATVATTTRAAQEYAHIVAVTATNLESAKNIRKQAGVDIRYQGPDGSWTTSDSLPTIEQVQSGQVRSSAGREYHVEVAPNGGLYLVAWSWRGQTHITHEKLLWMLLLLIVAVVSTAYWFQKRLLRPVQSLGGGVARMSAGQLDIVLPVFTHDELGLLTAAFNHMVRRVKEMIQARDQLLLDVSHELRSPLTRMKVALELLPEDENKAGLDSDIKEMEAMISELLELERLRTPHGICRQKQDLVPILLEVVQTFENRSPGVRLLANPQSMIVNIDANKIRLVLRNLLENAFKYSLPDSGPVHLCAREDQHNVIIRLRDDGQGIPEAHMAQIFEPFFRLDPSRSKKTGGYGLGLSICKRITEAHGGTIEVENNLGRGVSFTVTIPNTA
jgi:signal transduction histidine kinase